MGNEITKKGYVVDPEPCGTLGPKGVWSVYGARHKANGRKASVLMFDKARLAKAQLRKDRADAVLKVLRNDIKRMVTCVYGCYCCYCCYCYCCCCCSLLLLLLLVLLLLRCVLGACFCMPLLLDQRELPELAVGHLSCAMCPQVATSACVGSV